MAAAAGEVTAELVRAGGGVLWRAARGGDIEVCVIHRPKYDDWSLPKGKVDPGETDARAAQREVTEETGFGVALGPELATTRYTDRKGRPKQVRYWMMTLVGGEDGATFVANDEVDVLAWLPLAAARAALTWDHDRDVVDAARPHLRPADTCP